MRYEAKMKSNSRLLAVLFLLAFFFVPSAQALDIPLLTWERGKEQNLVLGGNIDNEWQIELINESNVPVLKFSASGISANGFRVYSVSIPNDFPVGAYAVRAAGIGIPGSIVAGVNVVALSYFEVVQIPLELLLVFLGYVFITSALTVMRERRFGFLAIQKFDDLDLDVVPPRLGNLHRLRERATRNLNPSLFQLVLAREGSWLRRRSHSLWSLLPVASAVIGGYIGIQVLREGGFGKALWLWLFLGALIALVDLYSSIIAFVGFIFVNLIFGDIVSLRDVMALLAVGLGWIGSYAISATMSLLHDSQRRSERETARLSPDSSTLYQALLSGAMGTVLFHAVQILILSLVITVTDPMPTSWMLSALMGVAVAARILIRQQLESRNPESQSAMTWQPVGRVISASSAGFLALFFVGTMYIWVRDWIAAVGLGFALVAPYALLLIRFNGPKLRFLLKIPRNALGEAAVVTLVAFLIFQAMGGLPFEVLERSRLFLILGVIPVLLHSLYSMLWDIADRDSGENSRDEIAILPSEVSLAVGEEVVTPKKVRKARVTTQGGRQQ